MEDSDVEAIKKRRNKGKNKTKLTKDEKRSHYHRFIDNLLRRDGVFLLALININAGELASAHITARLWRIYIEKVETTKGDSLQNSEQTQLKIEENETSGEFNAGKSN